MAAQRPAALPSPSARGRGRGRRLYSVVLLPLFFALAAGDAKAPLEGAALSGTVVDATTGKPVARAIVMVPELDRAGKTDGQGRFAIPGIPLREEPYELMVRAFGYKTWTGESKLTATGVVQTEIRIEPLGY